MKQSKHVNIDGDVVLYAVGFASQSTRWRTPAGSLFEDKADAEAFMAKYEEGGELEKTLVVEPVEYALSTAKRMIRNIVKDSKSETYTILLTGSGNFREELATIQKYKGNRDDSAKPVHYQAIKDYLINVMKAEGVEGEEADDQLSIRAMKHGHTIATIDKDLDNTPGWHYNWQKKKLYLITETRADINFFQQMLTGDATDNIPGLFRITGTRAKAAYKEQVELAYVEGGPTAAYATVYDIYYDALFSGDTGYSLSALDEYLLEIGRLLWMRREEGEMWTPPTDEEVIL